METDLLTPKEVAEALRVGERTVVAWLRDRKLRGIKVGGRWRIHRADLTAYLTPVTNHQPAGVGPIC